MSGIPSADRLSDFIRTNTRILTPPHVPEIRLHLATELNPIWRKTEDELEEIGLPPPFWAFAWAGGQGLARYILDNPTIVAGKRVLDFASGSGLVGIAASIAGAGTVRCADIDPYAREAVALNTEINGVTVEHIESDQVGNPIADDVVLAGDVFYDSQLAGRLVPWFAKLAADGVSVLIGDPGRAYLPVDRLTRLAVYEIASTRELEDQEVKRTTVWRFA